MAYSVENMESDTATLRRRLDVLEAGDGPAKPFLRASYISDLTLALKLIGGLAGRLSAAEENLKTSKAETRFYAGEERSRFDV